MCTVVVRWTRDEPVLVLALRDEVVGRAFDEPAAWWPEVPGAVAGRDRQGGGTWCATDVASGRTALVLNRPQRPVAAAGAPSRGVLPLFAVQHGERWTDALDIAGMASFALVLAGPDALVLWEYDGERLTGSRLPAGVHVVTSGGAEDGAERHLPALLADVSPQGWERVVTGSRVADDATALLVRHEQHGVVFATVFGQVVESEPGLLRLTWSRTPEREGWSSGRWPPRRTGLRALRVRATGYGRAMSTPDDTPVQEVRPDADTAPRPEEELADAAREPAAGGDLDGPPAQGEGAPDSW